jgi:hypothetical protein
MKSAFIIIFAAIALFAARTVYADNLEQAKVDSGKTFAENVTGTGTTGGSVDLSGSNGQKKTALTQLKADAPDVTGSTVPAVTADVPAPAAKTPVTKKIGDAIAKGMKSFTDGVNNLIGPVAQDIAVAGLGAGIGFLFGGPIGAVIGAIATWFIWKFL